MKIIITLLIIISMLMNCNRPIKKATDDPPLAKKDSIIRSSKAVLLGSLLIDSVNKTVSHGVPFDRDEPNGNHVWGTEYKIDTSIDFETTCLYVTDHYIGFKEHYVQPILVGEDGKYLDISEFECIGNDFYKKDGAYYFIHTINRYQLRKVTVDNGIHIEGLTAAGQNFLYDGNGLYFVRYGNDRSLTLITVSKAKNCRPTVRATYCAYNGKAFTTDYGGPEKINADPAKLYEIDKNRDGKTLFLTDGATVFLTNGYHQEDKKVPGLSRWKQLSAGQALSMENKYVNLLASLQDESVAYDPLFFLPDEGFFTVNLPSFQKKEHYTKVFIFNFDKGAYEEIDVDRFELHVKDFFTYKDRLHYKIQPVENKLDAAKLRYNQGSVRTTDWLCDGKRLIHIYALSASDAGNKLSFGEVAVANVKQLKVVTDELLVDGVNFYQFDGREIEVIPIESLGVEVKIDLSTSAWTQGE